MSESPPITTVKELAIIKAGENFDDWQDCTCADPDEEGNCWYHLTEDQQMDDRVRNVADRLEINEEVVRWVLEKDRA